MIILRSTRYVRLCVYKTCRACATAVFRIHMDRLHVFSAFVRRVVNYSVEVALGKRRFHFHEPPHLHTHICAYDMTSSPSVEATPCQQGHAKDSTNPQVFPKAPCSRSYTQNKQSARSCPLFSPESCTNLVELVLRKWKKSDTCTTLTSPCICTSSKHRAQLCSHWMHSTTMIIYKTMRLLADNYSQLGVVTARMLTTLRTQSKTRAT